MFPPFLLSLIIALVIVGVALYILSIIPMDATIKQVIRVIVIVVVAVWILSLLLHIGGGGLGLGYGSTSPCR
jgi:hypothetical protein